MTNRLLWGNNLSQPTLTKVLFGTKKYLQNFKYVPKSAKNIITNETYNI